MVNGYIRNNPLTTEGEALAEACEDRGVQAVLAIVLSPGEVEVVRRPGLKALARLASDNHQTLLEIGVVDCALCSPQVVRSPAAAGVFKGWGYRWSDSGSWKK